ncbi:PREDICTED: uncharacterized protein LOC105149853 [Acromyrmex echinatior]|uniref:uncharacterized protein LOC105149853 n=1 Tax=Acromyrmex echinatior TaxID=103372 RepID=UPI000580DAF1|nr:PREDICTED: uncharacterized protein LOC105149853 [Acromyrmex echinatior]
MSVMAAISIMAKRSKLQQSCACHQKIYAHQKKKPRDRCKKKRQVFVYNPEEEIWHEPYMQLLHHEFSDKSVLCDSKIELPWRDIALRSAIRIRPDATAVEDDRDDQETDETRIIEKRESTGAMTLPWHDLLITETLRSTLEEAQPELCDSSVEIPWADLALEMPMEIRPSREQICATDDVEVPWNEILMPRNIVIKSERKRQHPSSKQPPRSRVATTCIPCGKPTCCVKIRAKTRTNPHENVAGSNWVVACM